MIEQDPGHREHPVGLPVVLGQEVPVRLGHPVRAARMERGLLGLRALPDLAEHLRRGRLVEADLPALRGARGADPAAHPDGFQHPEHADAGHLAGQLGLLPGHGHVGDGGQVVDLVRLDLLHRGDQAALVEQVAADQPDVAEQLADAAHPGVGLPADQPPDLITLGQQVLGQVRAVLPGDPGDQRAPRQRSLRPGHRAISARDRATSGHDRAHRLSSCHLRVRRRSLPPRARRVRGPWRTRPSRLPAAGVPDGNVRCLTGHGGQPGRQRADPRNGRTAGQHSPAALAATTAQTGQPSANERCVPA